MVQQFRSPINLNIPLVPAGVPDELEPMFRGIYNALRSLQQAIGDFSGTSYATDPDYFSSLAPTPAQSIQVQNLQLLRLPATVTLTKGQFVNIFDNAGVVSIRKADATAIGTRAWGWAMEAITSGNQGMIALLSGYNGSFAGMTKAATYYLSSSTPGGISTAVPVGTGKIIQEVGVALSATDLFVNISTPPIVLP